MSSPSQPSAGKSALGCAVMLFIVGVVIYSCSTNDSSEDSDTGGGESMAEAMCEQFVTERLKAPSTADFPGADLVTSMGNDEYEVTASVDSQNGFGAMIRTDYVCTIQYAGGDEWRLVSLDLNE